MHGPLRQTPPAADNYDLSGRGRRIQLRRAGARLGVKLPGGCVSARSPVAGQSTRPNPTANFAGAERTTILSAQPRHGRRRALLAPRPRRRPLFHDAAVLLRSQKWGVSAAVTGMIALTALSAAQADSGARAGAPDQITTSAIPAFEAAVSAAPSAVLTFDRPAVTSQPAPTPAPAAPVEAAGTVAAPAPEAPAANATPSAQSKGLRAPLAAMNVSSPFGFRVSPITGAAAEMHTGID